MLAYKMLLKGERKREREYVSGSGGWVGGETGDTCQEMYTVNENQSV